MWLRCGVDEWHLECEAGGDLDLSLSTATPKDHDYIAAVRKKDDHRFELFVSPSHARLFDSTAALNDYLGAVGLEKIDIPL